MGRGADGGHITWSNGVIGSCGVVLIALELREPGCLVGDELESDELEEGYQMLKLGFEKHGKLGKRLL